jgi:hypothetical protein
MSVRSEKLLLCLFRTTGEYAGGGSRKQSSKSSVKDVLRRSYGQRKRKRKGASSATIESG